MGDYRGDGQFQVTQSTAAAPSAVSAGQTATNTTAVTTSIGGVTQSAPLTNVFVVTDGAEIATKPLPSPTVTPTATPVSESPESAVTVPLGDLTNGICNNLTFPLGVVIVADFFRRNRRRKQMDDKEVNG
jgi:hypothetical protein